MRNKKGSINKKQNNHNNRRISASGKKNIFWFITLSFPFVFFVILETSLRIVNYGGNLDLFVNAPEGYENYLMCNINVAGRYFYRETNIPTPPLQLFKKIKSKNAYRVFVLGASTAAGYPYDNNASFPNILERGISNSFPNKEVEVINISMSAVNSYTLLDLTDEIFKQSPDALLIYAGHNEYYGALGVGSAQSLGEWRWLVRSYLKLQSLKSVLLLRDFLGWIKYMFAPPYNGKNNSGTLMSRVVGEQVIPYGSRLYELGKEQFKENMDLILEKAADNNVPVVLSELVSNIKDQPPFISLAEEGNKAADFLFNKARGMEKNCDYESAKKYYKEAKDRDALRFRVPEEFNSILHNLAKKYSLPVVNAVSEFEKKSPHGLIGNSLILEHLHPNLDGYYLLAKSFFKTMSDEKMIGSGWKMNSIIREEGNGVTELDSVYGSLEIKHLKRNWPFQKQTNNNSFIQTFRPQNQVELTALKIIKYDDYELADGHTDLGRNYEMRGMYKEAFSEYYSQIVSVPFDTSYYIKAVKVLLKTENYNVVEKLLRKSLKYKNNLFAFKWIGLIALLNEKFPEAIEYLSKADQNDPQVIFNLGRYYYQNHQWQTGEKYYQKLAGLEKKTNYISLLRKIRKSNLNRK